ncbi:expressed unknown protein [Ectocarpus siliculosus]|uniref:Uncharacterized protein n=1 Tax=Ectocarpus siliculosus TaxID=2880 RepID=D8LLX4_ECTSI|nr:expressed unknown protein [Ectocarpus siliculosus]|eukprot:CBN77188.1 expressed unknown protein [Ectocarpus siliculosus]
MSVSGADKDKSTTVVEEDGYLLWLSDDDINSTAGTADQASVIEAESGTSVPHSTASRPPSTSVAIVQSIKAMQQQLVDVSLNGAIPVASDAVMARYRGAVEKFEASQKALTTVAVSLNAAQRDALKASDDVIEAAREAFGEDPEASSDSASGSAQMNPSASLSQEKRSSPCSLTQEVRQANLRLARVEQQLAVINVCSGSNTDRYPPTSPNVAAASKRLGRLLQRHLRVTEKENSATRAAASDGAYAKLTVHGYHQNAQVLVDTYRCSGSACRVFSLVREYKRFAAQKAKKDASVVTHLHNMAASRYGSLLAEREEFKGVLW